MKIFDIVQLNFKQLIRDKKNLFFLLLFPAVFMLIFGIGFGDNVESDIDIAIVNHDDEEISRSSYFKSISGIVCPETSFMISLENSERIPAITLLAIP